jgi:hypothetical protein
MAPQADDSQGDDKLRAVKGLERTGRRLAVP